jgi:hypothetical protein
MDTVNTVKPVISNKAVLAYALSSIEGFSELSKSQYMNKLEFNEEIGSKFFEQMNLLADKNYLNQTVDRFKNDPHFKKIATDLKKSIKIDHFMRNPIESLSKGYISLINTGFVSGDYIFVLKSHFVLAHFLAVKKCDLNPSLSLHDEIIINLEVYKKDISQASNDVNELISKNKLTDLNSFSASLLNEVMSKAIEKNIKIESFILSFLRDDYGEFTSLD